jgi:hypothetical protein
VIQNWESKVGRNLSYSGSLKLSTSSRIGPLGDFLKVDACLLLTEFRFLVSVRNTGTVLVAGNIEMQGDILGDCGPLYFFCLK